MIVKNISNQELSLVGIGTVQPGGEVEVPADFHNANFEIIKSPSKNKVEGDDKSKK